MRAFYGHEEVGHAEVTVELRDLVFEHPLAAEGVPGELVDDAMVLVEIVPVMSKNEIRLHRLQRLHEGFQGLALVREVAATEVLDDHVAPPVAPQERIGAGLGLGAAHPLGGQHHPVDLDLGMLLNQAQHGRATADLDVVGMRAEEQHAPQLVECDA